jgi:molybdate-binding protein
MENQHRQIRGYRELDAAEIDLVNAIKDRGADLGLVVEATEALASVDKRALAIAKTQLQTGLMWLVRSVTKPESF